MAVSESDVESAADEVADDQETTQRVSTAKPKPATKTVKASAEPAAEKQAPSGIVVTPLMLGLSAVVVLLAVAATAFGFLWQSAASDRDEARGQLAAVTQTEDRNARAKDMAVKYAISAAGVDYQNLDPWRTALVANTTPELANTLKTAATDLEQMYVPLQWQSSATPLGAIVASDKDDLMIVNVFLNVITKNTQRPQGLPSVATYSLTIDTKQNWVISDVSSVNSQAGGAK